MKLKPPFQTGLSFLTGQLFMTSKEALDALVNRRVQGTLLDFNEAANLQAYISANGLKISKKIDSISGFGFVLSDSMASFHTQIRSYVTNNYNLIQSLVKNFTKEVVVSIFFIAYLLYQLMFHIITSLYIIRYSVPCTNMPNYHKLPSIELT